MVMPGSVSAAGPSIIDGKVTDSVGRPIVGAAVTVVMKNGTLTVDTASNTTDGDGFYTISFAVDKWAPGFNVTATATYNSVQTSDNATVDDGGFATIDLQFPFEIPQFGSILGFVAAAGLIGAVAVVFLVRKNK
jgi:hypothetical protein